MQVVVLKYETSSGGGLRAVEGVGGNIAPLFFFFVLVTGPRRSLILKLRDTRVYEP